MVDALIIDACRTPRGIGKAGKGALTSIHPQQLGAAVLRALAERTGINTADVDDIIWGTSSQRGPQSGDLGRMSALDAGYDVRASGVTLDRFCGSGITSVNMAAAQIMLPAKERRGSPTGGGSFYIFKSASPEQQKAAVKFIQWMTAPERAAEWSIKTGYVAVSPAAYKTPAMEAYAKSFPAAIVARDQLEFAVPELSVHVNSYGRRRLNVAPDMPQTATGCQGYS